MGPFLSLFFRLCHKRNQEQEKITGRIPEEIQQQFNREVNRKFSLSIFLSLVCVLFPLVVRFIFESEITAFFLFLILVLASCGLLLAYEKKSSIRYHDLQMKYEGRKKEPNVYQETAGGGLFWGNNKGRK